MNYGQVVFSAHIATVDSSDAGPEPDIVPISGYVDFIPSRVVTYADNIGTMILGKITAGIDDQGVLRDPEGNPSVTLISADSPELSHREWTYEAHIRLNGVDRPIGPYYFVLHSNEVFDLGSAAPAEMSNGIAILRGPKGDPGEPGPVNTSATVTSVNGMEGAVTLTAADVGVTGATTGARGLVRLAGDLGGTADAPVVPLRSFPIFNFTGSNPPRPATAAQAIWVAADNNRPAGGGSTAGGSYAAAEGDLGAFYTA